MDYRIVIIGFILLCAGLLAAYEDSREGVYYEVSGILLDKEKRIDIVQSSRSRVKQFNIYLYLEGQKAPFIYREFDEASMNRYWPSFTLGDKLTLYVHADHSLVWGMAKNGVLVLNPKYKQKNEVSSLLWISAFGFLLGLVGVFWKRITNIFSVGHKYS